MGGSSLSVRAGGSRLSVEVGVGSKSQVKRRSKELPGVSDEPDPADPKWTTEVSAPSLLLQRGRGAAILRGSAPWCVYRVQLCGSGLWYTRHRAQQLTRINCRAACAPACATACNAQPALLSPPPHRSVCSIRLLSHLHLATRPLPPRSDRRTELGGRVCRTERVDPLRRRARAGEDGLLRDRPGRLGRHRQERTLAHAKEPRPDPDQEHDRRDLHRGGWRRRHQQLRRLQRQRQRQDRAARVPLLVQQAAAEEEQHGT